MTALRARLHALNPQTLAWFAWPAAMLALLLCDEALGRVGGGQSYSGSSGRSSGGGYSGGGGDGDGAIVYLVFRLLLWLCLEHPAVGVPLTVAVVVGVVIYKRRHSQSSGARRSSGTFTEPAPTPTARTHPRIDDLRRTDPNFSTPLFMDFIRLLYVRVHEARGSDDYGPIRPYLSDAAIKALQRGGKPDAVFDVVVGSAGIARVKTGGARDQVTVTFEANYSESTGDKKSRFYVVERWRLGRKSGVLSKGPDDIAALRCPSCGSAVQLNPNGSCQSCGNVVTGGNFHWQVETIAPLQKGPPAQVAVGGSGGGPEHGLDRPTVFQPNFAAARKSFAIRYPDFRFTTFQARVKEAVFKLNEAWSSKDWQKARPYETDHLFDSHRYWIERYQRSGLTNTIENIEITKMVPCKIEQDAFFDAITVRVFAQMLDYTVRDSDGQVVDGSKTRPRQFSEYWTLVRRSGFDAQKVTQPDTCPSCGAPLEISMTGVCDYCSSRITTGEFDWVLAAIDQDEDYRG